jgi:ribonuclease HII
MVRVAPDFSHETQARFLGALRVAGVDEVGRGPLAGPVTACAVVLDPTRIPEGLADSKMLTAARREMLFVQIMAVAEVSVAHASVEEIDTLNILRASHLAMERAVAALSPDHALIDGAVQRLAEGTEGFAAARMNRGIQAALTGRTINEI